jgi:hypothetical protein
MPDLVFTSKGSAEVLRQQTLINERAAEMASIYKDDARAARDLENAVGRIFKNVKEPSKQFNEEMGKLLRNMKDGKINAEQYAKGITRLEKAYGEANTFGGRLKGTMMNMFGADSVKMLQNYALGLTGAGGVLAAFSLIKSEIQSVIDLQDKATQTKLDVGQARNLMVRNMLGSSPQEITSVLKQSTSLAGELRLPEPVIAQAMAEAMSASGGTAKDAFSAVRLAGKFLPDQQGEIGQFAGSLIDLQKVTGSSDQRVNFGLLASISQKSRIASPQAIAANAPKALIGAAGLAGATGAEGAAFYSALTNASADITGSTSSSATIDFSRSLGITFPKQLRKAGDDDLAAQFEQMSMGGKIAMLQNDPALAKRFLTMEGLSLGNGDSVAPLRSLLLDRNSGMARGFAANMASMPGNAGLTRLADEAISNFNLNPLHAMAESERSLQSFRDNLRLKQPDTLSADARASLLEVQQNLGGSNIGSRMKQLLAQVQDGSVGVSASDSIGILESERKRLLRGRQTTFDTGEFGVSQASLTPATVEDKENAKLLGQLIDVFKQQVEQAKETNRKLDESGRLPVTNN